MAAPAFIGLPYSIVSPDCLQIMIVTRACKFVLLTGLVALTLVAANTSRASVVIAGTRVIYDQREPEVTLKVSNVGKSPSLIQTWIDKGNAAISPSSIDVPFTITPPVARIDPGKGQTLRIIYTGEPLPQDHESVFWLNVLEIPPKPAEDEADANKLQLAFRSRIKLFFRPQGLKGVAQEAPAQVSWRLVMEKGHPALQANNPSVYHVTFTDVTVTDGITKATFDDGGMVEPGASATFLLNGTVSASPSVKVRYHALNDYGGPIEGEAPLQQSGASESSQGGPTETPQRPKVAPN
jgi:chaperone protein EcpD